jgi:hypothetical protein
MTVSSVGASASAYYYLQSLLPSSADGQAPSDPVDELLNAFYPNGAGQSGSPADSANGASGSSGTTPAGPTFSPDTMASLMSLQEQPQGVNPFVAAHAQALFSQLDGNGDGQISKSEFENVFGSNADQSKVDGLFNALDSNGDGSVSQDELTSAMQASHAHHHHHHADPGQGAGDIFQALTSGTQGATANTTTNADGSSTTTISYVDGSSVSLTTPQASTNPGSGDSGSANSGTADSGSADSTSAGSGSAGNSSNSTNYFNLLEQLIRLQAQSLSALASQNQTTSQTLASV